jgi:hypothetical protein
MQMDHDHQSQAHRANLCQSALWVKTRSGPLADRRPIVAKNVVACMAARGAGALRGNKNVFKHGLYTHDAIDERRQIQDLQYQSRKLLSDVR